MNLQQDNDDVTALVEKLTDVIEKDLGTRIGLRALAMVSAASFFICARGSKKEAEQFLKAFGKVVKIDLARMNAEKQRMRGMQ